MGKNQAYKAMQRAKMSSHTGSVTDDLDDGMMDGSFHSPEWHAARLASLQKSHTITWEEFKQKQKEEARKQNELEDSEARLMREYRAQLDAERAAKLSRGRNHKKGSRFKKSRKDKEKKRPKRKKSEKKRRRSDVDSEDDGSCSGGDSSGDEAAAAAGVAEGKKEKRSSKSKREKRHKRRRSESPASTTDSSSSGDEKQDGPMRLSTFFDSNGNA